MKAGTTPQAPVFTCVLYVYVYVCVGLRMYICR